MFFNNQIKVISTGSYTPQKVISNKDLEKSVKTDDEWIYQNLGIRSRCVAGESEYTSDLCYEAARAALEYKNIDPQDIDLVIVATATPDRKAPSVACLVKHKLRMDGHCPAFDISAVCSGFMYALSVAGNMLSAGAYKKALVIGGDTFSKITDWARRDCVFFGDGAGAVVVEHDIEKDALFSSIIYSESSNPDHFTVYPEDDYFTMNGRAVYETATKVLPATIEEVLEKNGLKFENVNHVIPHQPSIKILQKTSEITGIPFEKFHTNMETRANTSGGTIPILLDEINRDGKIKEDELIIFAGVGSGWTWGAGLLRW